jgi:hypothetical protein
MSRTGHGLSRSWSAEMGPCRFCGGGHLHSVCRVEHFVLPLGYCCPTAALIKAAGARRAAAPLDWSRTTLAMWAHVLADGGEALASPAHVARDARGRPSHAVYREPAFARAECWVHGLDAESWARRCARLRVLLHDGAEGRPRMSVLGLHVDFEAAPSADPRHRPYFAADEAPRLAVFAADAARLGAAVDGLAGCDMRLVAILCVPAGSASATPGAWAAACGGSAAPEQIAFEVDAPGGAREPASACFSCARPRPNVTVLRYVLPHSARNRFGNPLPSDQHALLPEDACRVHALLRALYDEFFPAGGLVAADARAPAADAAARVHVRERAGHEVSC